MHKHSNVEPTNDFSGKTCRFRRVTVSAYEATPSVTLMVYDDGQCTGEIIRLRRDRFIIGRSEGDLLIPDDDQISKRHVALTRQCVAGQVRWVITDLQSREWSFVRVNKAPLSHQAEFLLGSGRYKFELVQKDVAETTLFCQFCFR